MRFYFVQYHDKNKKSEIIKSDKFPNMRELGLFSCSIPYSSSDEVIKGEKLRTDCKCKMCGDWIRTSYNKLQQLSRI
jgi:hypothetical protein